VQRGEMTLLLTAPFAVLSSLRSAAQPFPGLPRSDQFSPHHARPRAGAWLCPPIGFGLRPFLCLVGGPLLGLAFWL